MKINRRTFIEASALTVAGAFVSSAGIPEPQRRSRPRGFGAYDAKAKALAVGRSEVARQFWFGDTS
jgi:hypothetical protein